MNYILKKIRRRPTMLDGVATILKLPNSRPSRGIMVIKVIELPTYKVVSLMSVQEKKKPGPVPP